ncbi:iron complex transport system substrate-binding protein [Polaromonas sp. CG_9.5]|uniref:heme/hemin ABC transporter substrate-binding protein n=1 Tax=Polaromonas sp. CG_9.5 TaxID=3071705 RepID=UPI002E099056|nr:iron complex transport system substrate-binding protein [Polaromonas sp. CG_9.5]
MNAPFDTPGNALSRRAALRLFSLPAGLAACVLSAPAVWSQTLAAARLPRIVSVNGAMTEIAFALGAGPQLAGTDTTSLFPEAALRTPKVGYMRQLSAEGLLSLKPDTVIGTTEAGPGVVMDQLRSAGVNVALVEADHTWAEVQRKVAAVGQATARGAEARALQVRLDAEWAGAQATVARRVGRKPRAIFILSHAATPQVAGRHTAADAMLNYAGFVNAFTEGQTSPFSGYRPMTAEALASAAPEVIVTTTQGIEAAGGVDKFWSRPGLALTPAYRQRALVALDALYLIGFGPRLPQAVIALHQAALKVAA